MRQRNERRVIRRPSIGRGINNRRREADGGERNTQATGIYKNSTRIVCSIIEVESVKRGDNV